MLECALPLSLFHLAISQTVLELLKEALLFSTPVLTILITRKYLILTTRIPSDAYKGLTDSFRVVKNHPIKKTAFSAHVLLNFVQINT